MALTSGGGSRTSPVVFTSFYNEMAHLPAFLEGVRSHLPEATVIGFDGTFEGYAHSGPVSTDGSVRFLREAGIEVVEGRIYKSEAEKRNRFFEWVKDGDYWIYLDADEVVTAFYPERFEEGLCRLAVPTVRTGTFVIRRLFVHNVRFRFATHYQMVDEKTRHIYQMELIHDAAQKVALELKSVRQEKNKKMTEFKKTQTHEEITIMKQYRKKGYRNAY